MALGNVPTYFVLGTNKISAGIGTVFSTARFVKNGYVTGETININGGMYYAP